VRGAISDGRPYRDSNESGCETSIRKTTSARTPSHIDLTMELPHFPWKWLASNDQPQLGSCTGSLALNFENIKIQGFLVNDWNYAA
jgi:hypothetical protein